MITIYKFRNSINRKNRVKSCTQNLNKYNKGTIRIGLRKKVKCQKHYKKLSPAIHSYIVHGTAIRYRTICISLSRDTTRLPQSAATAARPSSYLLASSCLLFSFLLMRYFPKNAIL